MTLWYAIDDFLTSDFSGYLYLRTSLRGPVMPYRWVMFLPQWSTGRSWLYNWCGAFKVQYRRTKDGEM